MVMSDTFTVLLLTSVMGRTDKMAISNSLIYIYISRINLETHIDHALNLGTVSVL